MGDFFDSKFIRDLGNGKLPVVEVKLSTEGMVQLFAGAFFTACAIILAAKIVRSI
jgi:hypothetical protein